MPELLLELFSEEIPARLQARAADDLRRLVTDGLKARGLEIKVHSLALMGHAVKDYRAHISDHHTDLLIMQARDDDQLAMRDISYSLSIELREIPLLLV